MSSNRPQYRTLSSVMGALIAHNMRCQGRVLATRHLIPRLRKWSRDHFIAVAVSGRVHGTAPLLLHVWRSVGVILWVNAPLAIATWLFWKPDRPTLMGVTIQCSKSFSMDWDSSESPVVNSNDIAAECWLSIFSVYRTQLNANVVIDNRKNMNA